MPSLSPLRARLASFEHAYLIAIRLRQRTGQHQFVVGTEDPLQPIRVTPQSPASDETLIAKVL